MIKAGRLARSAGQLFARLNSLSPVARANSAARGRPTSGRPLALVARPGDKMGALEEKEANRLPWRELIRSFGGGPSREAPVAPVATTCCFPTGQPPAAKVNASV